MGLSFDDSKLEFLSELLIRRAERQGLELDCYLDRLEGLDTDSELQNLALELTVPETYFFRHIEQLHAFADVALPDARAARAPLRKINVLCVGCASGEEPYSLAILIRERYSEFTSSVAIRAVDINTAMLTKAARGCYSAWALRETSSETQRRWFRSVGREFVLEESIRDAVTFQEMGGLEVLRRLRAEESTRRVPVVVLTSSNEERDILSSYDLGANSFVRK
ncbi:MAG TPA: CheR family methyltransferase, partial [Steroidobacteraceae bacterium]|nr:CheR family methyltransferase [Steroidobacteraceae bacterium]